MRYLTTAEAADSLGVGPRRVRAMIKAGTLKADRVGRDWLIDSRALAAVENRRPGRPRRDVGSPSTPPT